MNKKKRTEKNSKRLEKERRGKRREGNKQEEM